MELTSGQKMANEVLRQYDRCNFSDLTEVSRLSGALAGVTATLRNEVQILRERQQELRDLLTYERNRRRARTL